MDHETPPPPRDAAPSGQPPSHGQHLATVSHAGLLWDVYVEHDDDPTRTDSFAGCLCFSPAGGSSGLRPVRTAAILIEPSYEEIFYRARAFEEHHLVSLLRSLLPEDGIAAARAAAPEPEQPDLPAADDAADGELAGG